MAIQKEVLEPFGANKQRNDVKKIQRIKRKLCGKITDS